MREDFNFYDGTIVYRFVFDISTNRLSSSRSNPIFATKSSRSHFEGNRPRLVGNKETRLLIPALARHDSNATGTVRLSPRAASCRARSMFCRSLVLPHPGREPLSPPLDPRRPSRRRAFGEYGSALTILPSEPPRLSTDMIYAAAFHIFHCFQVFGSICKIKFVMREHPALPSRPLPCPPAAPPFSVPRVTPPPSHPVVATFCCAHESTHMADRSISSRAETSKPDVVKRFSSSTKLSFFSRRMLDSLLDK